MAQTAAQVQAEFDAFKQQVGEVAMRIKQREGYCDSVDEFLEEVGITPEPPAPVVVVLEFKDFTGWNDDAGVYGVDSPAEAVARYLDRYGDHPITVTEVGAVEYVE